jgi:hypothetical protein
LCALVLFGCAGQGAAAEQGREMPGTTPAALTAEIQNPYIDDERVGAYSGMAADGREVIITVSPDESSSLMDVIIVKKDNPDAASPEDASLNYDLEWRFDVDWEPDTEFQYFYSSIRQTFADECAETNGCDSGISLLQQEGNGSLEYRDGRLFWRDSYGSTEPAELLRDR